MDRFLLRELPWNLGGGGEKALAMFHSIPGFANPKQTIHPPQKKNTSLLGDLFFVSFFLALVIFPSDLHCYHLSFLESARKTRLTSPDQTGGVLSRWYMWGGYDMICATRVLEKFSFQ